MEKAQTSRADSVKIFASADIITIKEILQLLDSAPVENAYGCTIHKRTPLSPNQAHYHYENNGDK